MVVKVAELYTFTKYFNMYFFDISNWSLFLWSFYGLNVKIEFND